MDLLLGKAKPISSGGSASGIMYLRRRRNCASAAEERSENVRGTALQTPRLTIAREMEKFQGSEGKKEDEEKKYLDVISNKNIKLSERVLIPVKQYPKLCAGQFVQKDPVRDNIKSFTEIQKDYISWLALMN
ncbi:hypothetical protein BTVI_71902 [Pitangus sulphuratus]|nr:hypothetical protein BTVI_71902 [Pitangus sulphuratus]